jgi:hypothetical protein
MFTLLKLYEQQEARGIWIKRAFAQLFVMLEKTLLNP